MKNMMSSSHKYKHWGLLALRLGTGIVFIFHGWGKLTDNPGIGAFTGMLTNIGIPAPALFAWLVALIEFVGGILLVAGVFVQWTSVLLAIIMLVALVTVKKFELPQAGIDISLLGSLIAIWTLGPGKYAVGMKSKGGHQHTEACKNGECAIKEDPGKEDK